MHSHLISRLPGAYENALCFFNHFHTNISNAYILNFFSITPQVIQQYGSTNTQISSLELIKIPFPMTYTHNYIPYNCDILLIHEVHALTYPFPHKSSHSFHQFQEPNTWTFLVHFTQTRDCFYSPKTEHMGCLWAAHSSNRGSSLRN